MLRYLAPALLLLLLGAEPAAAGPIAAAVAWVGAKLAAGGITAALMRIGMGLALNAVSLMLAKSKAGKQRTSIEFEVQYGDNLPLAFTLGRYATAGQRKFISNWGDGIRYITEVIEYSALPQGVADLWINDEQVSYNGSTIGVVATGQNPWYVTGIPSASPTDDLSGKVVVGRQLNNFVDGRPRMWVRVVDGTQVAADPLLVWIFSSRGEFAWTEDHIGHGKSYLIVTGEYSSNTLPQWPTILIEPRPLPLYDPRLDSSVGGDGPHRWSDRSTFEPSANPIVMAYNVARGIYYGDEWVFGGRNLAAWRLPLAEWVAAMNEADSGVERQGGGTEPAYRAGLRVTVGDMTGADVLEDLGLAANTRFAEVGGRLKPLTALPVSAVLAITDADIVITEAQSYQPFAPVSETYNALSATYPEPAEKWANKDAPEYIDTAALAADGDRYLATSVAYPAVPYAGQVQRLMRAQMQDYRRMRRHEFHLPPDAYGIEPLDMISWSSDRNGYESKAFLVESVAKLPGLSVAVSLREVDPGDYDWSPDFELPEIITPPVVIAPQPQGIFDWDAEGVLVRDAGGSAWAAAIEVSCDGDAAGIRAVRIQVIREDTVILDLSRPYNEPYAWLVTGVAPATEYQVRGQLISDLVPRSDWSDPISVTTPELTFGLAQIEAETREALEALEAWITADIGDLPARLEEMGEQISAEVATRLEEARQTAADLRRVRDRVRHLAAEALDLAAHAEGERAEIRRSLDVQTAQTRASFAEQITVVAGTQQAVAQRVTTLEAETGSLSASISLVEQALAGEIEAVAQTVTGLSVGTSMQFDAAKIWHFDATTESWTGGTWVTGGFVQVTSAVAITGLSIAAGSYGQVRARLKKVGSPTWAGNLNWGAGNSAITEPTWSGDEGYITLNPGWSGTITALTLTLASGGNSSNHYLLDWIAVGRPSPGASSAELAAERQARITADTALASDITATSARMTSAEGEIEAQADGLTALTTRVTTTENEIEAQAERVEAVETSLTDPDTGNAALADAIDLLRSEASTGGDGSQRAQSEAIRTVRSVLRQLAGEALEGAATAHHGLVGAQKYVAEATTALTTRIDAAGGQINLLARAVTSLETEIPGLAKSTALQALQTLVSAQGAAISSQSTALTQISSDLGALASQVGSKASATALSALETRVTATEGSINSHSSSLTSLSSGLTAANAAIATKASSTALSALSTRVTAAEGALEGVSAISDALTALSSTVGRFTASGLFRVTTEAAPSGAQSRIGLYAAATGGESASARSAAFYLEAVSGGSSRALFEAGTFAISNGGAGRALPFVVDDGNVYIAKARIKDGDIDNAKIGNVIQSTDFVTGPSGAGWKIDKAGAAEFNNIVIRRQIEVASGSLGFSAFTPADFGEATADADDAWEWARENKVFWARSTPIEMTAWLGPKVTYIATASLVATVFQSGSSGDVYWGVKADVMPLTRWLDGSLGQRLRLRLGVWTRRVTQVGAGQINWKIYAVS